MRAPALLRIDHIHVFVRDRAAAVRWYAEALGLAPLAAYAHWAEGGGPLTLADPGDAVHLALFERPDAPPNRATVALATDAPGFAAWQRRLAAALGRAPALEDHGEALSLYFNDPDGNPYEITTYDAEAARAALGD
ncbi:MAG TPA: VOC family protein [Methylibium sp.]|nr:VOC family protein [Methylibium sp.]